MDFKSLLRERSVDDHAAFFSEYLRESDNVLDCGCGAGSITTGLARRVRTGGVVGVDLPPGAFGAARAYARRTGLRRLTFCLADMTQLPFADESFSAVFCHSSLETLRDPLTGLTEARRVLRAGGVIGVACVEYEGVVITGPNEALLKRFYEVREELWRRASRPATSRLGKHLRALLHRAGYERVSAHLAYVSYGTEEAVRTFGTDRVQECRSQGYAGAAVKYHLVTPAELDRMACAWEAWVQSGEAFFAFAWSRAIGWKPGID